MSDFETLSTVADELFLALVAHSPSRKPSTLPLLLREAETAHYIRPRVQYHFLSRPVASSVLMADTQANCLINRGSFGSNDGGHQSSDSWLLVALIPYSVCQIIVGMSTSMHSQNVSH